MSRNSPQLPFIKKGANDKFRGSIVSKKKHTNPTKSFNSSLIYNHNSSHLEDRRNRSGVGFSEDTSTLWEYIRITQERIHSAELGEIQTKG